MTIQKFSLVVKMFWGTVLKKKNEDDKQFVFEGFIGHEFLQI